MSDDTQFGVPADAESLQRLWQALLRHINALADIYPEWPTAGTSGDDVLGRVREHIAAVAYLLAEMWISRDEADEHGHSVRTRVLRAPRLAPSRRCDTCGRDAVVDDAEEVADGPDA